MNSQQKSPAANTDVDAGADKTPNTDMQPEDAGTPESGSDAGGRGNAAETAMKQTSKTGNEKGTDDSRQ
jgi:hypothetical protein